MRVYSLRVVMRHPSRSIWFVRSSAELVTQMLARAPFDHGHGADITYCYIRALSMRVQELKALSLGGDEHAWVRRGQRRRERARVRGLRRYMMVLRSTGATLNHELISGLIWIG
jgi:hypothetical protein